MTNQIATIFCYYNTDILSCLFCDIILIQMRCNFSVRAYATEFLKSLCQKINFSFRLHILVIYFPVSLAIHCTIIITCVQNASILNRSPECLLCLTRYPSKSAGHKFIQERIKGLSWFILLFLV